ncbi:hypothetical protein RIF29_06413 [Crotalaria pallida]|uniref:Uncharacterized protein n=1 Tax=Crotalaria pallida TaxID=3830 RepID=A0AAN9PB94_CROPI
MKRKATNLVAVAATKLVAISDVLILPNTYITVPQIIPPQNRTSTFYIFLNSLSSLSSSYTSLSSLLFILLHR